MDRNASQRNSNCVATRGVRASSGSCSASDSASETGSTSSKSSSTSASSSRSGLEAEKEAEFAERKKQIFAEAQVEEREKVVNAEIEVGIAGSGAGFGVLDLRFVSAGSCALSHSL